MMYCPGSADFILEWNSKNDKSWNTQKMQSCQVSMKLDSWCTSQVVMKIISYQLKHKFLMSFKLLDFIYT